MFAILRVTNGPDQGQMFTVVEGETLTIGRGQEKVGKLHDPAVARKHCEVRLEDNKVVLTDAGSASGTLVNSQRVSRHELQPGDLIRLGNTFLSFQWSSADEEMTQQDN